VLTLAVAAPITTRDFAFLALYKKKIADVQSFMYRLSEAPGLQFFKNVRLLLLLP
jgi:hypothetical protein